MLKLNSSERYAVKTIIFITGLYSISLVLLNFFITDKQHGLYASIAFVIVMSFILYFGQDKIFGKILLSLVPSTKEKKDIKDGTWQIVISFEDSKNNNEPTKRSGTLHFENAFIGMKVIGGRLLDMQTEEIERVGWFSEDAEILDYEGKKILKYIYKIYGKTEKDKVEKVGVVVATKAKEEEIFSGIFTDISLAENQISRSGQVVLYPTKETK